MENLGGVIIIGLFLVFAAVSIYVNWKRRTDSNDDNTGSE